MTPPINDHPLSAVKVAATFIGTIVGAGFASGQEILQFFGWFGVQGLFGVALSTVLLSFFGVVILLLGHRLQARSHQDVISHIGGSVLGLVMDWAIILALFGGVTAMTAGAGAAFYQEFGLPQDVGRLIMIGATVLTVLLGIGGVINAISAVVPLLMVAVLGVSLYTLFHTPFTTDFYQPESAPIPWWPMSATIYASYNLILAVAVLAPMGSRITPRALRSGGLMGGLGLGCAVLAIHLVIMVQAHLVSGAEIPMLVTAGRISPVVQLIYVVVLLAEIYTTAVASLYGFVVRIAPEESRWFRITVILAALGCMLASRIGFSEIVATVYSGIGYIGLLMLAALSVAVLRGRHRV